ncbi:MAG TPA: FtsX-like permease family protein, partial [Allocoleopsis sp.]
GQLKDLKKPYTVFVDENNLSELNIKKVKDQGILGILPAEVVGFTKGTNSLIFGGLIFTSLDNANAYSNSPLSPQIPCHLAAFRSPCKEIDEDTPKLKKIGNVDYVTFILIKAKQGEDLTLLKQRLEQKLTGIRAYSKEEMAKLTQNYWTERSGIGFVLGIGAVVGIVVGIVIVGQILYSSVSDHIKEFGTLKAMGASDWVIYGIIIEQSLWMAVLGYLPGIALCYGVAKWTAATQAITILITPYSAVIVFGVTVIMCVSSAIFAIQKVTKLDPAIVFKT